ncbi:ABC transporter substrate-binding protein [Salinarimonas soli]|uniref:Probable sugar-binding periplasmic protein n=1 Tax=Salinarimonas soli TaxID=1638099 RepID=A0A5B2V6M0_9HYPH|nr:ABC transporter substrate-binding protein [Salinarimonas soli]KAA2234591.1 carbohydrate ABC transporter substrate-binding protein [Salinarimonas soli]
MKTILRALLCGAMTMGAAHAQDGVKLEVMHWWTSGGEAAAVRKLADGINGRTAHSWVDSAIAGGVDIARPVIISRIIGGSPPTAFQFNPGRQALELIEAGLLLDLTDVAKAQRWAEIVNPPSLLEACTVDGRVYCAPVNIHSWNWMWLSGPAYEAAGLAMPADWTGFLNSVPALRKAGITPLAMGGQAWQQAGLFNSGIAIAIAGPEAWLSVMRDRNADVVRGEDYGRAFQAYAEARTLSDGTGVQDWNQATRAVMTGRAAAQFMGDWAQAEFALAGKTAGVDYGCLPGLGLRPYLQTGGDAFFFPKQGNPAVEAAQKEMAALMLSPEVQVSFNSAKRSLPVRGDVDLTTVNECTRQGLDLLAKGRTLPSTVQLISADTNTQLNDLLTEFWNTPSMTAGDVQERYARIIADAR